MIADRDCGPLIANNVGNLCLIVSSLTGADCAMCMALLKL